MNSSDLFFNKDRESTPVFISPFFPFSFLLHSHQILDGNPQMLREAETLEIHVNDIPTAPRLLVCLLLSFNISTGNSHQ